jgi:hypothetical protein
VETDRDTLDWQNTLRLAHGHELVAGLELTDETTAGETFGLSLDDGSGDGDVDTEVYEAYVADNFDVGSHSFMLALRHTDQLRLRHARHLERRVRLPDRSPRRA